MISFSQYLKEGDYPLYHKTFTSASQAALDLVKKRGFEIDDDDWFNQVSTGPKKPGKGKTNRYVVKVTKNGRETKKRLAFQVYGMDSGKYELNAYVESTNLEENVGLEDGRRVLVKSLTKPAALRLQKKLRNKFSRYDFNIDKSGLNIIVPNEKPVTRYIKQQPEVDTIGEATDLEESVELQEAIKSWEVIVIKPVNKLKKNQKVTVKAANTVTAIKKAAKLFKIDDKLITGKVDVKLLESTELEEAVESKQKVLKAMIKSGSNPKDAEALIKKYFSYVEKKYSGLSPAKKAEVIVTLAATESYDVDKELDIKSLKDLIKNPSPKMIKQYGGKDKYIKMLKSKLAKLESIEVDESIDLEKANVLTADEYDEVQNFQNFNKKDWRFDKKTKTYNRKKKV